MLSPGARGAAPRSDPLLPRPMAVYRTRASAAAIPQLEILFKVHGRGTALLADARAGRSASRVVGPLGTPFPDPPPGARAVIVGGRHRHRVGVRARGARCTRAACACAVLLGARSAGDLMGEADFAAIGVDARGRDRGRHRAARAGS